MRPFRYARKAVGAESGGIALAGDLMVRGTPPTSRLLMQIPLILAACTWLSLPALAQRSLYDAKALEHGEAALRAGNMDRALRSYCEMFEGKSEGTLWTLSAMLVCEASQVASYAASIQRPLPVFVQVRVYQGRPCYRICAGVTRDRNEAVRWRALLPKDLLAEGPFPVPVTVPCSPLPPAPESDLAAKTTSPPPPPAQQPPLRQLAPVNGPGGSTVTVPESDHRTEGEAWFRKGLEAQAKGQRARAAECYRSALEADPDRPEVLNNLGILSLQDNRYDEARTLFERAVAKSPSYARAHLNLAGALWGLGQRSEAIAEARRAVGLDAKDVSAHLTLASFLLAQNLNAEASEEARRALLLDPGNEQAKVFLGTGAPP